MNSQEVALGLSLIHIFTLGVIGSFSSLLIRLIGDKLMQWKVREVAQ